MQHQDAAAQAPKQPEPTQGSTDSRQNTKFMMRRFSTSSLGFPQLENIENKEAAKAIDPAIAGITYLHHKLGQMYTKLDNIPSSAEALDEAKTTLNRALKAMTTAKAALDPYKKSIDALDTSQTNHIKKLDQTQTDYQLEQTRFVSDAKTILTTAQEILDGKRQGDPAHHMQGELVQGPLKRHNENIKANDYETDQLVKAAKHISNRCRTIIGQIMSSIEMTAQVSPEAPTTRPD